MIKFWIQDNGPGIAQADQVQLFTPFTQLSHSHRTGHGLGLSIVQRIVHKLNGTVGVTSELGEGSCFWFTLPMNVTNMSAETKPLPQSVLA